MILGLLTDVLVDALNSGESGVLKSLLTSIKHHLHTVQSKKKGPCRLRSVVEQIHLVS